MSTMGDMEAIADASGRPSFARGRGMAWLLAYNLWAWPYLTVHTASRFTLALLQSLSKGPEKAFSEGAHVWARGNMRFGGFRLVVEGELPDGGSIVTANHRSLFDIAVVLAVAPPPLRFVARRGIRRVPVVGSVLQRGGHILVDRESTAQNDEALARAARLAREGNRIVIFPEGTRSRDGRIGPLRSGGFRIAAAAGVPVVPLVLSGTHGAFEALVGPIRPTVVVARFLPARSVTLAEATDPSWRHSLREEMADVLDRIAPGTGPRI